MRLVVLALYLLLTLSLSACDWIDGDDVDSSGGSGTVGTTAAPSTNNYHHWNPRSWEGKGSSLVLCPDAPKFDSCELEGRPLARHGNKDKGRWIWTDYNTPGLSGNITCRQGSTVVGFSTSRTSSMQYGDC